MIAGAIVGVMLLFATISLMARPHSQGRASSVKALVRQSAHFCGLADQDSNAVVALLHATSAQAYITAARSIVSDAALERSCHVNAAELQNAAEAKQRRAVAHINHACPSMKVQSDQLRAAGWVL